MRDVYCYAEKVPTTDNEAFNRSSIDQSILHVPAASINKYKANNPWSSFKEIVPLTDSDPNPTGIKTIGFQNLNRSSVYDLNGRRLTTFKKDISIFQTGDKETKKVVVK